MSENISLSLDVQISGGPKISASQNIQVEAYDSIKVTIRGTGDASGADTDKEVEVQPGGTGQVSLLTITSNRYDSGLTYKVNSNANPGIELDKPHVLAGQGAVGLLDAAAPTSLFFSSAIAENAEIHILVGRKAT
ncbi:MAG: hypothetical protein GY807_23040 [Gammaproteobacteria bacterium]|nr:hypothetical protein [Gammaproteobacteria bacterium]